MRKFLKEDDEPTNKSEFFKLIEGVINGEYSSELTPNRFEPFFDFDNIEIYYNPTTPKNSPIKITFEDMDDFLNLFGDELDYSDKRLITSLFGGYYHYRGDVNFFEWDTAWEDWKEGYVINRFNDENITLLKEILQFFPELKLDPHDFSETAVKLSNIYEREINDIITEYQTYVDEGMTEGVREEIKSDLCGVFNRYNIFEKRCMSIYLTNISTIYRLLLKYGTGLENNNELLKVLINENPNNFGDYYENVWNNYGGSLDEESFNQSITRNLEAILEKIEEDSDPDKIEDLKRVLKYIGKLTPINDSSFYEIPTMKDTGFKIVSVNTNGVMLDIFKRDEKFMNNFKLQNRILLSLDEFVPFIENYKLFESKKLRKKRIN